METAAGIEITAHRVGGIIRVWSRNVVGLITVGNMFDGEKMNGETAGIENTAHEGREGSHPALRNGGKKNWLSARVALFCVVVVVVYAVVLREVRSCSVVGQVMGVLDFRKSEVVVVA